MEGPTARQRVVPRQLRKPLEFGSHGKAASGPTTVEEASLRFDDRDALRLYILCTAVALARCEDSSFTNMYSKYSGTTGEAELQESNRRRQSVVGARSSVALR